MSSTDDVLSSPTTALLHEAGRIVEVEDGAIVVLTSDFELRYELRRRSDGMLHVEFQERAARPVSRVEAGRLDDVERWLLLQLRSDVRRARGFRAAPAGPPGDAPASGFTSSRSDDDLVVSDPRGPRMRFFRAAATDTTWVRWTHLADLPLQEVATRLTSAAGW